MRRHGSPQALEAIRLQAVALSNQGLAASQIARTLDRSERTVRKWIKIAADQGDEALRAKAHAGATPKLNAKQRAKLQKLLLAGATQAGFDTDLWTCPRVRHLIQKVFGVTYHVDYLPCVLRTLGFSCQKPQRCARERNKENVDRWVAEDWLRLKKKPAASRPASFLSTRVAFF